MLKQSPAIAMRSWQSVSRFADSQTVVVNAGVRKRVSAYVVSPRSNWHATSNLLTAQRLVVLRENAVRLQLSVTRMTYGGELSGRWRMPCVAYIQALESVLTVSWRDGPHLSRPLLRAVQDADDVDDLAVNCVHDDVGQW